MTDVTPSPYAEMAVTRACLEWANPQSKSVYAKEGLGWETVGAWCGAFGAFCHQGLHPLIRSKLFSSDYRLGKLFGSYGCDANLWRYKKANGVPIRDYHREHGGLRTCTQYVHAAQPGDILLVGSKEWGGHIAIFLGWHGSLLDSISGNGAGLLATGKVVSSGVVRAQYHTDSVKWVIRPAPADFDQTISFT